MGKSVARRIRSISGNASSRAKITREQPSSRASARHLRCDRHLSRRVNLKLGRDRPDEPDEPKILHDDRVSTGFGQLAHGGFQFGQLVRKHQRIQRDISATLRRFKRPMILGQRAPSKFEARIRAGMPLEPEVNRVGAVLIAAIKQDRSPAAPAVPA